MGFKMTIRLLIKAFYIFQTHFYHDFVYVAVKCVEFFIPYGDKIMVICSFFLFSDQYLFTLVQPSKLMLQWASFVPVTCSIQCSLKRIVTEDNTVLRRLEGKQT